jgi:hypothetical protein
MKNLKTKIVFTIMLLMLVALVHAVSAQGNDHSVTAEKAFEHANAQMIQFIATNTEGFGSWTGASIDPKPLELYDINGQKLYYQFSVFKDSNLIGRIYIGANKALGQSVRLVEFNPKLFSSADAMKKSIEIAKTKYPTGEIVSTKMVVYDYPKIGVMTIVQDKTSGVEHQIFVDVYTLKMVPDKPATETQPGVWSMYEKISKNQIDENLKKWQNSDELTKSIEQTATDKGVNINVPATEENIKKLRGNTEIAATNVQSNVFSPASVVQNTLSVSDFQQDQPYFCAPACAQMISAYYNVGYSQSYIYQVMNGVVPQGVPYPNQVLYYKATNGLNKGNSNYISSNINYNDVINEINNKRPFVSGIPSPNHVRVCRGYQYSSSSKYLYINDPWWTTLFPYWEAFGSECNRVYVK